MPEPNMHLKAQICCGSISGGRKHPGSKGSVNGSANMFASMSKESHCRVVKTPVQHLRMR